ncbi:MAG: CvpA family protein [Paracoccaceae bacterium]
MESFTLVDGIVALTIVVSALLAYARGLVREVMAIAGWIGATVVAFLFAGAAMPLVRQIPYVDRITGDSCELSIIVSFAVVFTLALVLVSFVTPLLSSAVQNTAVGPIDQGLGFLFGVVRGLLLVALAFFLYGTVLEAQNLAMIDDSRSAAVFGDWAAGFASQDPDAALGWITARYEGLTQTCVE